MMTYDLIFRAEENKIKTAEEDGMIGLNFKTLNFEFGLIFLLILFYS